MIDSGANGCFLSERFVHDHGIATHRKKTTYGLIAVDGSELPGVYRETDTIRLAHQQHLEDTVIDVVEMANHDLVLGMPWLEWHNPTICWEQRVLRFERCSCVAVNNPVPRQSARTDETRELCNIRRQAQSQRKIAEALSPPTDTDSGQSGHEIVRRSDGTHASSGLPKEYHKWKRLFEEEKGLNALPRHQPWDHKIELKPGAEPPWGPIYPQSERELSATRNWLTKLEGKGWIRKSKSSAGAPILVVPKPNGNDRVVQDYRRINDVTIKNRYPLPNIEEARDRLTGANWFTKIDLRDAFYSIRMAEGEEWKTAFRTRYGHYEFLVMPMGLTNAPATCQQMINDTLRDLLDITVIAYVDDILIFTTGSLEQHIRDVQAVFERLNTTTFKTAPEKCEFHKKTVKFLGFIISKDGVRIDPAKTTSIQEWPTPKTVKDIQSFLGLANYNRKFIKDYSKTAKPLTDLTKKDTPFNWTQNHEDAFQKLKQQCMEAPTLRIFDPKLPIQVETDASDMAIGACLTQENDGQRHPLAYYSRKMAPAELNYDIHDKELLAIVAALMHWRVYAEGAPGLIILSDHKNLTHFTTTKQLTRRQVRWSELLGQYKFEIRYTPGRDNGRADALSRRSDYMNGKEAVEHSILKANKDGSLSANVKDFGNVLRILRDTDEEFPILQGKFQVRPDQEQECIQQHHDDPTKGHPGISKTVELIQRKFTFPQIRQKVTKHVKQCLQCQQNKAERHAKYGHIQFIDPPEQPWDEITMDFITKLPGSVEEPTGNRYDSIFVVVDRLTKYTHFIPYNEEFTVESLAKIFIDRIIRHHGIPKSIISDRDKLFTSAFWKTLVATLGIKLKLSTAFHPTTDGQTERMNQTLEVYLRHYVNHAQDNWVSLLPMAQLALNNGFADTIGTSPFFANFGKDPNLFMKPYDNPELDPAMIAAKQLKDIHAACRDQIRVAQTKTADYLQDKRKMAPQLKKGDKVYLLTKNLKTRRPTKKLDQVKVGPFLIEEQKGPQNYRLKLPKDARIHPVFHISLLEPAAKDTPLQTTFHFQKKPGMTSKGYAVGMVTDI
ncbi:hypothetical protein KC331_g215 [Hortaea werneckii]|nr:hypothetical protein KC361_g8535 [Hortaea werneckii]KAI6830395.1 hypothetical protein KC342_g8453 [Hortaea werneckii]KAI6847838.1 hypothetical protein KC350_g3257 [Hortaea werneckii]KAI7152701.1 hypothetical protein KC349_g8823 [Hortaea werneckii]KAI7554909.1 hypothetical protein KC331_g215 [Hortaea werneckii]